jgi:tryptophan 2,3-dioxygenase
LLSVSIACWNVRGLDAKDYEHARARRWKFSRISKNVTRSFNFAESLLEHDEYFSLWRSHHIKMVERMVGAKRGTGGSEGIGYLKTTLDKKFFPSFGKHALSRHRAR